MSYGHSGDFANRKTEDDDRKLFVGGLSWETTKEQLKEYFEQFGDVTYCALKTDPNTLKSRGFGFITFADESSVIKVVQERKHQLDGRDIDPKRAKSRTAPDWGPVKKIFVGGLDPSTSEDTIRDYFGKFGTITEFSHPYDKKKSQKKGFCFITFDKADVVHNIVGNQMSSRHSLGSYDVDVKKAVEQQQGYQQDGWGQGGWGGYQNQGGWGQGGARGGPSGGRGDRYDQGRGWGGDQGGYHGNYGGGSYGGGSYGQGGGYDGYGGGQQGYYGGQGNYHSNYGNGYD